MSGFMPARDVAAGGCSSEEAVNGKNQSCSQALEAGLPGLLAGMCRLRDCPQSGGIAQKYPWLWASFSLTFGFQVAQVPSNPTKTRGNKNVSVRKSRILRVVQGSTSHSVKFIVEPWEVRTWLRRQRLEQFLAVILWAQASLSASVPRGTVTPPLPSIQRWQQGKVPQRIREHSHLCQNLSFSGERDQAVFCQQDLKQSPGFISPH